MHFLREALVLVFTLGLAAQVGGYARENAVDGGPPGLLAELPASLGATLWTGVILVALGEVLPEARRRWLGSGDDALPGIGLDPETAAVLPRLLRNATALADKGTVTPDDGTTLRAIDGASTEADIPGVVAAGGQRFTKLIEPVTFGFDATGRLAWLRVAALNTNSTDYDLVVATEISLAYDAVAPIPSTDGLVLAATEEQR
jgi:hypothetical protein